MEIKKFSFRIFLFSCLIMSVSYILYLSFLSEYYLQVFPFLVLFFMILTTGIHAILVKAGRQRPARFSTFFMGSVSVKLFVYIVFILIYIFSDKDNAAVFLITFFILYILYTSFETYSLLNAFKKLSR